MPRTTSGLSWTYWMGCSNGVFYGFTSDFINKSKAWETLFILHFGGIPHVFDPVLQSTNNGNKRSE